ncbi:hypothetical protein L1887_14605 [Cichorium endivia]|nr:hypothetical protein L1887_14605 [Cichorium endivia]
MLRDLGCMIQGNCYTSRADALIDAVKGMMHQASRPLSTLEFIDDLQRLGIAYHFVHETSYLLEMIYHNYFETEDKWNPMELNLKALGFRLLRQHGYHVPQEIFGTFKDELKIFKPHLYEDMLCMLNLYEASYLSFENESILDDARDFTTRYLQENLENIPKNLSSLVTHALELPLHRRVPRVEAKWFIEVYEKRSGMHPTLIELAKLDFNMVQAIHLQDLKCASRWWRNTSWDKELYFARDRLVENFMWTIGFNYLPHFSGRETLTKVNAMITTIDDIYDVYDLCKAYMVEARWYHSGHTPTLKEYLDNACITIGAPVILTHLKILTSISSKEEMLQGIESAENIVRHSSLILRLADDLETSSDESARGDTPKSVQCYMHETGATENEARRFIEKLIDNTWKKINKERAGANSQILKEFNDGATNLARMAQFMYGVGDGHGCPELTRPHVLSLLFNPIEEVLQK